MREPLEQDILRVCLEYLKLRGVCCWRQNQGSVAGEHKGRRRFLRFASADGISDIIGLLPPGGRLLAVEVKRPGKQPTATQQAFLDAIGRNGGLAVCVHSLAELEAALGLGKVLAPGPAQAR